MIRYDSFDFQLGLCTPTFESFSSLLVGVCIPFINYLTLGFCLVHLFLLVIMTTLMKSLNVFFRFSFKTY